VKPVEASSEDLKAVIESYNQTALQLLRKLKSESGNLVISPFSIGTAMSMVLTGARGETHKEMAKALNQTLSREPMDSATSMILSKTNRFEKGDGVELVTANALSLTPDSALVSPGYKKLITENYQGEIFKAQDADAINAWVSKKTKRKIAKILENSPRTPSASCSMRSTSRAFGQRNSTRRRLAMASSRLQRARRYRFP